MGEQNNSCAGKKSKLWCWCLHAQTIIKLQKEEQGSGIQKKQVVRKEQADVLLQFCLQKNERERDPKGEKKKSSFTDPDLPDSAREAKKNLLLCASDHAWHHGMHLLAAWPGTCLEREREQEKDEEKRKNRLKDARQVVKKLGMAK